MWINFKNLISLNLSFPISYNRFEIITVRCALRHSTIKYHRIYAWFVYFFTNLKSKTFLSLNDTPHLWPDWRLMWSIRTLYLSRVSICMQKYSELSTSLTGLAPMNDWGGLWLPYWSQSWLLNFYFVGFNTLHSLLLTLLGSTYNCGKFFSVKM